MSFLGLFWNSWVFLKNFPQKIIIFFENLVTCGVLISPGKLLQMQVYDKPPALYKRARSIARLNSCPLTQTPTQKFKSWFSMFTSQGIASSLVSFQMIFEALQSELFRLKFPRLSSKILKIPESNLHMHINATSKTEILHSRIPFPLVNSILGRVCYIKNLSHPFYR